MNDAADDKILIDGKAKQELGQPKIVQLEELEQSCDKHLVELMAAVSKCAIVDVEREQDKVIAVGVDKDPACVVDHAESELLDQDLAPLVLSCVCLAWHCQCFFGSLQTMLQLPSTQLSGWHM